MDKWIMPGKKAKVISGLYAGREVKIQGFPYQSARIKGTEKWLIKITFKTHEGQIRSDSVFTHRLEPIDGYQIMEPNQAFKMKKARW